MGIYPIEAATNTKEFRMNRKYSEQEEFWAGEFGGDYIQRNLDSSIVAGNVSLFASALAQANDLNSCIEFGANIGLNLRALRSLYPNLECSAVEINSTAAKILAEIIGSDHVMNSSILDIDSMEKFDLILIKGVLIHLNPDLLPNVYEKMYEMSSRYILVCEYYNPTPVSIDYRGHSDRLFKRDFAGEMLDLYTDLTLRDYGFVYHRDINFPLDDITWFLLEKKSK
jgi:pseudaminic acid biosynthesis-associated methylase